MLGSCKPLQTNLYVNVGVLRMTSFTTTHWVINRVHNYTAYARTTSQPSAIDRLYLIFQGHDLSFLQYQLLHDM